MSKFYLDAGTTWSKILEVTQGNDKKYSVLPSCDLKNLAGTTFEKACGHNFQHVNKKEHINEIVALCLGAKDKTKPDGIVLDLGSRDIKWAKYKNNKFCDMDWNASCGAAVGATVEMLLKFYNVKVEDLKATKEKYAITCGVFGLEKIMDDISKGQSADVAISKFVHGIAYNAWNFSKNPDYLHLSGGFCENKCFIDCLKYYCDVAALGRFILVEGLYE